MGLLTRLACEATGLFARLKGCVQYLNHRTLLGDDDETDEWWPHTASSGHVLTLPGTCWRCRKPVVRVAGILVLADDRTDEFGFIPFDYCAGHLAPLLSDEVLAALGAGPIRRRYSHTVRESYLSNGCLHCDAIQGNFFLSEDLLEYQMHGRTLLELTRIARLPISGSLAITGHTLWVGGGHDYPLLGLDPDLDVV